MVLTTLMNVCQRAGEHERAIRLFRTMEADGLSIDVVRCHAPIVKVPISCIYTKEALTASRQQI